MLRSIMPRCGIGLVAFLCALQPSNAAATRPVDPASIEVPNLGFSPDPSDSGDYDKYFYFHREDTDFATAYADIRECDSYSRNFGFRMGGSGGAFLPAAATLPGVLGGALGSAIGNGMADAIHGSAERRKMRRLNMSACMGFKDYKMYGLPKNLWLKFNFEEGLEQLPEERRDHLLQVQAKVASGPKPLVAEIGE